MIVPSLYIVPKVTTGLPILVSYTGVYEFTPFDSPTQDYVFNEAEEAKFTKLFLNYEEITIP